MKLYTEEQVRKILKSTHIHTDNDVDMILPQFTPIELPSDDEIEDIIRPFEYEYTRIGFKACAEWIKNKIQGGNK